MITNETLIALRRKWVGGASSAAGKNSVKVALVIDTLIKECFILRQRIEELEAALRANRKQTKTRNMLQRHGFVFSDLDDRWQKLAFSLYNIIIEIDEKARHTLGEVLGGQNERLG